MSPAIWPAITEPWVTSLSGGPAQAAAPNSISVSGAAALSL